MTKRVSKFLCACLYVVSGLVSAREPDPVILIAGDVAQCNGQGAQLTGQLINSLVYPVLVAGDLAYPNGTAEEFARCYEPTWGAFKTRTYPAPGNHEYRTAGAKAYFDYFGTRAGDRNKGYYSFDVGQWHVVSLNSNRELERGSPQMAWLKADLKQHRQACVLAYWHHPRFSSGPHGDNTRVQALWALLYQQGVSAVVTGHDHDYERFAPMNESGEADPVRGMRAFIVGTGGAHHYHLGQRHPLSEVWEGESWGVLKLTLGASSYAWEFLPVGGSTFHDAGSGQCVQRASASP